MVLDFKVFPGNVPCPECEANSADATVHYWRVGEKCLDSCKMVIVYAMYRGKLYRLRDISGHKYSFHLANSYP